MSNDITTTYNPLPLVAALPKRRLESMVIGLLERMYGDEAGLDSGDTERVFNPEKKVNGADLVDDVAGWLNTFNLVPDSTCPISWPEIDYVHPVDLSTPRQIAWIEAQWGIKCKFRPDNAYNQIDGIIEVTGHDMKDDPGLANPKHCIGKYRMGSPKTDGEAMYFMSSALVGDDVQANYPDARYEDLADMELGWTPSGERFQWEVTP